MTNGNRYRERHFISGGRFSSVYRATDHNDGTLVALKITTPEEDRPPHNSRDELKLLKLIKQSGGCDYGLLHIQDSFFADQIDLVIVTPYLPFTLTQILQHNSVKIRPKFNPYLELGSRDSDESRNDNVPTFKNQLSDVRAREIIMGIARGLDFLHSNGIIHRDIKPANILFHNLTSNPTIIDFGISYAYPDNFGKEPSNNKIRDISTSIYKAPELIFGISDYSYGVDIWSFGIMISSFYTDDIEPVLKNEGSVSDWTLVSQIFQSFGVPTLDQWPEGRKSSTFGKMNANPRPGKDVDLLIPRADGKVKALFKKMMVFESSNRVGAKEIINTLSIL
ncbi:Cyclin-dependent kinase [Wickerhamomyces ciferrii]|uniref:Cyclin-dependent kinase n=1 Tax=Wickerhamomyces ciferrii (strain ATCC 14091 / BCRC 22168 / CBS 111 / JCM 3599 / NBRC 0793 / NRRL Y-1031 F-60-10) TaxID=1206466 RepID=K0KDG7_WICCF|nr:Cyclin-dependent kinase [Wickerhamomyces ciferrii]CCH40966.1 Cyclin-dependent kinase [Wickerhamomyces ciferrii]